MEFTQRWLCEDLRPQKLGPLLCGTRVPRDGGGNDLNTSHTIPQAANLQVFLFADALERPGPALTTSGTQAL